MIFASSFKSHPTVMPLAVLLVAMLSIQVGAALSKQLFPLVGPSGATALRLAFAALMLGALWRPWRMRPTPREIRAIVAYGLAMGWMNYFFYQSLTFIPLGIAVALEFTGPLAVAMAASRRPMDFAWIGLAAAGLLALLPAGAHATRLAPAGIAYALAAGACWALYIVFGQRTGTVRAGHSVAAGTWVAALVIVPFGIGHAGKALFQPSLLPLACGVALLSSALPYSLEMLAMTRLPARTFGVLLSLEPAIGALSGWVFLHEALRPAQWLAVTSIMIATAGSAATSPSAAATGPSPD